MSTKDDGGLRPLFKHYLPRFHWTPVESPMTEGIPDTNWCYEGVEGWIEFKQTDTRRLRFRPGQPRWIHRRYRDGGRVWIVVRFRHEGGPRLGASVDDLVMIYGGHILEIAREGIRDDLVSARWRGGPRRWPWKEVGALLVGAGSVAGGCPRIASADGA